VPYREHNAKNRDAVFDPIVFLSDLRIGVSLYLEGGTLAVE
jgi:hypothetical protein